MRVSLAAPFVGALLSVALFSFPASTQEKTPTPSSPPPQQATTLPGGASALSETHGDWTVNCRVINNAKACAYSFQQLDRNSNQRAYAVELTGINDTEAMGTLALPFGLALGKGVSLSVDDKPMGQPLAFSTCLLTGCLVPVSFPAAAVAQLKAGVSLKVTGTVIDTGQEIHFSIPLNGFANASKRTSQLLKPS